jgi:hypothetical protein
MAGQSARERLLREDGYQLDPRPGQVRRSPLQRQASRWIVRRPSRLGQTSSTSTDAANDRLGPACVAAQVRGRRAQGPSEPWPAFCLRVNWHSDPILPESVAMIENQRSGIGLEGVGWDGCAGHLIARLQTNQVAVSLAQCGASAPASASGHDACGLDATCRPACTPGQAALRTRDADSARCRSLELRSAPCR